ALLFRLVFWIHILIHTAHPSTTQWLGCGEGGAKFRESVEGEGVVAENACLVDTWQQQDLLYSNVGRIVMRWLQSRREDEGWRAQWICGIWWNEDKMKDLGGGSSNVSIRIYSLSEMDRPMESH